MKIKVTPLSSVKSSLQIMAEIHDSTGFPSSESQNEANSPGQP